MNTARRDAVPPGKRRVLGILAGGILGASALLGLGVAGAVWFSRTGDGRDLALEWALAQMRPWVNGTLTVGSLAPRGLLGGATLFDVELRDHAGHPVARVDSVRARYSPASWFALPPAIADVELSGLAIDLAPEGRRVALGELIRRPPASGDDVPAAERGLSDPSTNRERRNAQATPPLLRIRGLRVRGGALVMHGGSGGRTRVHDIDLDLPLVELVPDSDRFATATVANAALRLPLGPADTLALTGIRGTAEIGPAGARVVADRFRLPRSEGAGQVDSSIRDDRRVTTLALQMEQMALADLAWIDRRLQGGSARGGIVILRDVASPAIDFDNLEVELDSGGRLALTGTLIPGDIPGFRTLAARAELVATAELDRFLAEPLPLGGLLTGNLRFDGPRNELAIEGEVALLDERGRDTLLALAGRGVDLGSGGVAAVDLTATSFDYGILEAFVPGPRWQGRGLARIRAAGRLETGLTIDLEADHAGPGAGEDGGTSRIALAGNLYGDTAVSVIDLNATLDPLELGTLTALLPDLAHLKGSAAGSLSLRGDLDRLAVAADLSTTAGPIRAEAVLNARDLAAGYEIRATSDGLDLSLLSDRFPDSTIVAGSADINASGLDLESLQGSFRLHAGASRIGSLGVDSTALNAWVDDDGILHVEHLHADVGGIVVQGGGLLGAAPGKRAEGVTLALAAASIRPLRDLFMGEQPLAWDELPSIEQELMIRMDGVDPDTLPRARDIRFAGALDAQVTILGGLDDLSASTTLAISGLEYRHGSAASLAGELTISGLRVAGLDAADPADTRIGIASRDPAGPVIVEGALTAEMLAIGGRSFHRAVVEGQVQDRRRARLRAELQPAAAESYEGQAVVRIDEGAIRVDLDRLTLALADRRWNLLGPARIEWTEDALAVSDFGLIRTGGDTPGGESFRLVADGRLARQSGVSDFELHARNLDLAVLGRILQMERFPVGVLTTTLAARGTGRNPGWIGEISVDDARYRTLAFDSVRARGRYGDLGLTTEAESWTQGRRALHASGTIPLDLRFEADSASPRQLIPDRPINLAIVADSLPAALALAGLNSLEGVRGTVTAAVDLRGRPSDFEPSGEIRMEGVSAFMPPLGIALSRLDATMTLSPDGLVRIGGSAISGGVMEIAGAVDLGQPSDSIPLDLVFRPRNFQVVDRADMEAVISSEGVRLTGNWDFPFIEGEVDVEEGTVFMEEFQRTAGVVDLYDPALFSAATTRIGAGEEEESAAGERIPFLENLRVLVDARVGRGNWLRSRRMNVETTGDLSLTFDRRGGQLVLAGDMAAERGTYKIGTRTLRINDGAFQFVGTPGFNPGLSISADTRLRTREGQPLVITADIAGTLLTPNLSFTSDAEAAISEADLVNYLVIGRPTSVLIGTAGAPVGAGRDLLLGELANEIGYFLARELNLDHLSVSQSEQTLASAVFGASSVQVEAGRYILDDLFLTAVYQRGFCADPTLPVNSGSVRFEMGMPRDVRLEGFLEGRCTREGYRGLGETALSLERIWGFSLFREWGY